MPGYQDHLLFGAVLVLVFSYLAGPVLSYGPEMLLASAAFILLASVFPDIDHANSVIHRRAKAFLTVAAALAVLVLGRPRPVTMAVGAAAAGTATYLAFEYIKPRHRTVTHTFTAAVVFAAAVGAVSTVLFGSFLPALFSLVAYCSHIGLDRLR